MGETSNHLASRTALSFALTVLMIGLSFALPVHLIPTDQVLLIGKNLSPEAANVYACVAWAGWAHFLFAFFGQGYSLVSGPDRGRAPRIGAMLAVIGISIFMLFGLRHWIGYALFGGIVWTYFIDHFIKAERVFAGDPPRGPAWRRWFASYRPLLSFTWLSIVLLSPSNSFTQGWSLWVICAALGALILLCGGWKSLVSAGSPVTLLSLFFVAESAVWGTIGQVSNSTFLAGVYIFHIAAGSYFHYAGSYIHALSAPKPLTTVSWILVINGGVIALGIAAAQHPAFSLLRPILGIEWFTLWVAVHLVASDAFPWLKQRFFQRFSVGTYMRPNLPG